MVSELFVIPLGLGKIVESTPRQHFIRDVAAVCMRDLGDDTIGRRIWRISSLWFDMASLHCCGVEQTVRRGEARAGAAKLHFAPGHG